MNIVSTANKKGLLLLPLFDFVRLIWNFFSAYYVFQINRTLIYMNFGPVITIDIISDYIGSHIRKNRTTITILTVSILERFDQMSALL